MLNEETTVTRYPAVPVANLEIDHRVPLARLEMVADAHAHEIWGEEVARGQALPMCDVNGDVVVFLFPYLRGAVRFPEAREIFDTVRQFQTDHQGLDKADSHKAVEIEAEIHHQAGRYGSIYVSAIRTDFPILAVAHYLPSYFLVGEAAQAKAARILGSNEARLVKMYYLGLHEVHFEFSAHGECLLLNANDLEQKPAEEVLKVHGEAAFPLPERVQGEMEAVWERALDSKPLGINIDTAATSHTCKLIEYWKLVPLVVHTHWCAVTSVTMVLGFWDNYVKGKGTLLGYGRLINYWLEHSSQCHNPVDGRPIACNASSARRNNVPDLIDRLVTPGFKYDYNFKIDWEPIVANASNQWAWQELKREIDAGRPVVWRYGSHVVVAIGYRISNVRQKSVICLDTYGTTVNQKWMEHSYSKCTKIQRFVPGGGTDGDHLVIAAPDGGDKLRAFDPGQITWHVWGNAIKKTTISFSSDGGQHWTLITRDVNTQSGWNSYTWTPNQATIRGRIRVQGYTAQGTYIAGDGSHTNFEIEPAPLREVEKYQLGWKYDTHIGVMVLQFKDGTSRQIQPLPYKTYMSFADTLRNEKPVWYDENQALLRTSHEVVGEGEEQK